MTICVPRKPFRIAGEFIEKLFVWFVLYGWILGVALLSIDYEDFGRTNFLVVLGTVSSLIIFLVYFIDKLEKRVKSQKFIKWCDDK